MKEEYCNCKNPIFNPPHRDFPNRNTNTCGVCKRVKLLKNKPIENTKPMTKELKEATDIIHKYRMLLMDEGEEYGEEILVSELSIKMAIISVDLIIHDNNNSIYPDKEAIEYWQKVKGVIETIEC